MSEWSLKTITDRLEIEDLMRKYAWAIDHGNFDELDQVFTSDAVLDYTTAGGIKGAYSEVKEWLAGVLPGFPAYQHLVTNTEVTLNGDSATARSAFYNPMGHDRPDGTRAYFFCGGEYRDQLTRTANGWRINNRFEQTVWFDGEFPGA